MTLCPELNNLCYIMSEIKALDTATRELDYKRSNTNGTAALMFEICRDELNKTLEWEVRKLRKMLNDHYMKNENAVWTNNGVNINDPS